MRWNTVVDQIDSMSTIIPEHSAAALLEDLPQGPLQRPLIYKGIGLTQDVSCKAEFTSIC